MAWEAEMIDIHEGKVETRKQLVRFNLVVVAVFVAFWLIYMGALHFTGNQLTVHWQLSQEEIQTLIGTIP